MSQYLSKILVVGAFEPEVELVRNNLTKLAEQTQFSMQVATVGVGLVQAALGIEALLLQFLPDLCLFCGTCGVFPNRSPSIGDVVVARQVSWLDGSVVLDHAQAPSLVKTSLQITEKNSLDQGFGEISWVHVATTLGITTSDSWAERLATHSQADVEHMEAFAVALACENKQVPWRVVLGVANDVGSQGRQQWLRHHRQVGERGQQLIVRFLAHAAASQGIEGP
jgi:nucleoside phosphorylase